MGTFTVISAGLPPVYSTSGLFGTTTNCVESYVPFVYSTPPPVLRTINIGLGSGTTSNRLLGTYTGDPYKTLTILSFTVRQVPTAAPIANVAHLYKDGVEVTSFPLVIDIEGLVPASTFGLQIGHQIGPLCAVENEGWKIEMTFNIKDVNNVAGSNVVYTIQFTYDPA